MAMYAILSAATIAAAVSASGVEWKVLPIFGGGYVQNVVIAPSNPRIWYTYVDVGGLYRSDDAGLHWRPLHGNFSAADRNLRCDYVRGVSVDPRDEDRIVVCGGDVPWLAPAGIYASSDGGASFSLKAVCAFAGNGGGRWLGLAIARNPRNADELLAGEVSSGVMKSTDNGETWRIVGLEGWFLCDLKYDLARAGLVYACTKPMPKRYMGKDAQKEAFFRSDDGGESWTRLADRSPTEIVQLDGDPQIVAYFRGEEMRCSHDGGATWLSFHEGLPPFTNNPPYMSRGDFTALGAGRDFYLAGDASGSIFRRGVADPSWKCIRQASRRPGRPDAEPRFQRSFVPPMWALGSLVVDPRDQDHWIATDWFEVWESCDAGTNWTSRVDGIMQLVSHGLFFDPFSPDNIVYGVADMGMAYSDDGGRVWKVPSDGGAYISDAAFSGRTRGLVLATGGKTGTNLRRSRDAGRTWETPALRGLPSTDGGNRGVRAYSIAVDAEKDVFAVCVSGNVAPRKGGVYLSRNAGDDWEWSGNGLPTDKNLFKNGEWAARSHQLVCGKEGTLLLADVGYWKLWRLTRDSDKWELCEGTGAIPAPDPFAPGRYLACCGGVLKESTDGGATFHDFKSDCPPGIEAVAFDQAVRGLVVCGTISRIVYFSLDGGRTFRQIDGSDKVPTGKCGRVAVNRGRVYAFTAGSGVWTTTLDIRTVKPIDLQEKER